MGEESNGTATWERTVTVRLHWREDGDRTATGERGHPQYEIWEGGRWYACMEERTVAVHEEVYRERLLRVRDIPKRGRWQYS